VQGRRLTDCQQGLGKATFDPDVIEHLNELAEKTDRDRSWLVNAIIREHTRRTKEVNAEPPLFPLVADREITSL